jgi:uncharacterized protein DUF6542
MSEPRWSDADPRPLYRDEQGKPARRQPLPRERDQGDRRGRNQPDWQEPDPWGYGPSDRPTRGGRAPEPEVSRPRWGALPSVLGVCIVIGSAALGALVSAVTGHQPGPLLSVFLVVGTICAVLAIRPRKVYTIIPVPALAYLVASLMTGLALNQDGTTLTALAVGATQWVASGFVAMIIATVIAIAATIIRWPRNHGIRGPRRPPRGTPARATGTRSRRAPDTRRTPDSRRAPDTRRTPDTRPRPRRDQDRADSVATAAFPEWRREGRSG